MECNYNHRRPVEKLISELERTSPGKWNRVIHKNTVQLTLDLGDVGNYIEIIRAPYEHWITMDLYEMPKNPHHRGIKRAARFTQLPEDLQVRLSAIIDAHEEHLKSERQRIDVLDDVTKLVKKVRGQDAGT
jgi:hypothetical protein